MLFSYSCFSAPTHRQEWVPIKDNQMSKLRRLPIAFVLGILL